MNETGYNLKLKYQLMLQSLSPLALLTIIRNFSFIQPNMATDNIFDYLSGIFCENKILIVVMLLCTAWILGACISWLSFVSFKWVDKKRGYELIDIVEKEDASLNFFMTMIIPLLIDDVDTIQGAITFLIIVILMCALLGRTNLFYANPVLAILGYRVYEFTFKENLTYQKERCIGVCKGKISKSPKCFEYKPITDSVIYIKEQKNEKRRNAK